MKSKYDILIINGSKMLTDRLISMLKEVEQVGTIKNVYTYQQALYFLTLTNVDLALVDMGCAENGLMNLLTGIKQKCPSILSVVVMSDIEIDKVYKKLLQHSGADNFIDKFQEFDQLKHIISNLPSPQ